MPRKPVAPRRKKVAEYHLNPLERRISDDLDWAAIAPQVHKHRGRWVAVRCKKVIAAGADRDDLVRRAAAKAACPPEELAIVAVPRAALWDLPD